MVIDIIMSSLTNSPELHQMTCDALNSLILSEKDIKFNVILVESNKEWNSKQFPYSFVDKIIIPEEDFNYNRFCKIGLQHCKNEWVTLCNNDLIFHEGWFTEILKTYNKYPQLESFSPWNPYKGWHDTYMNQKDQYDVYEGYRTSFEVAGWCLITKRSLLNKINLDDRVNFWYSDNIYIDEMKRIGIRHGLVRNSKVSHICSATSRTLDPSKYYELTTGQSKPYKEGLI